MQSIFKNQYWTWVQFPPAPHKNLNFLFFTFIRRRFRPRKPKKLSRPKDRVNEQITAPVVFVIDDNGTQIGETPKAEAIKMARDKDLDLVEVAPKARPPVCKILNYGKFQYQQTKKERQNKGAQKSSTVKTKGVRIGIRTDAHDLAFKKKQTEKFLEKGQKVKIEVILRGREKAHQDLAKKNIQNFIETLTIPYKIEEEIKRFPGGFNTVIAPE